MAEDYQKQILLAKSHSTVKDAQGVCVYKGKKLLIAGFGRLPLHYKYSSPKSPQFPELHLSAVQDVVIKLGSYRRVSYSDLDIIMSDAPTLSDLTLIVEMGFKKLIILSEGTKGHDPADYFFDRLQAKGVSF